MQHSGDGEARKEQEKIEKALKTTFRPEFLNRIDEILIFHRLSEEDVEKIVHIQLANLNQLLADQGLEIGATDAAARFLAHEGFDADFGARPLKRTIQRLVQDPLARMVLAGEVGPGTRIQLDVEDGKLSLRTAPIDAGEDKQDG